MMDLPVAPPVITTTMPFTLNNSSGAVLAMLIICGVIVSRDLIWVSDLLEIKVCRI
jgi:hypothetical protein